MEEPGGDAPVRPLATSKHLHKFTVKFPDDNHEYSITCDQPGSVLRALQSNETYKKLKFKDENIVIQLGKEDRKIIIATHFPCCISEDKSLLITHETKPVEEAQHETEPVEAAQHQLNTMVDSRDEYSVFYIDTVGGLYTITKRLFLNSALKKFKYLCVYGRKGTTVKEALQRDGRFIDSLDNFKLSDNKNPQLLTDCSGIVDLLNEKKFKIRLPRYTKALLAVLRQRPTSVKDALDNNSVNREEVYQKLRDQFPHLRELMESRFSCVYQGKLEEKKEDFVKVQKSFSEVHRVKKLFKLGESVCKVVVEDYYQGTGFVLFDNFILTNAHLFRRCVEKGSLKSGTKVYALFNYEDPEPHTEWICYPVNLKLIGWNPDELDYAILEIDPEGLKTFNSEDPTLTQQIGVPPGLLEVFGSMPSDGEACIVGHPGGGVKQMDPTCIIEKGQRLQAVNDQLRPYTDTLMPIIRCLEEQGIKNVMMGGKLADKVVTYDTFMYHGASGSPVFDAHGRVFGLHTAGHVYGFPTDTDTKSVLEFAQPLLTIFTHFVRWLKENRKDDMLQRVKKAAKGNSDLQKILEAIDTESPTLQDEPMEQAVSPVRVC